MCDCSRQKKHGHFTCMYVPPGAQKIGTFQVHIVLCNWKLIHVHTYMYITIICSPHIAVHLFLNGKGYMYYHYYCPLMFSLANKSYIILVKEYFIIKKCQVQSSFLFC